MSKATINPNILEWAINNSHYSTDEIATRLGRPISIIQEWLRGEEYPTYKQLENIAYKILRIPMAIFFFPNPPEEEIRKSFRTTPKRIFDALPPYLIRILRKAKSMQIKLYELCQGKNPSSDFLFKHFDILHYNKLSRTSSELREFLGISVDEQFKWRDYNIAFEKWREIIEDKGIFVFKDAFKNSNISGFCLYDDSFPIIYVNNSLAKSRQIFTLFHELAHLFHQTCGIDDINDNYINELTYNNRNVEIFCNKFSGEFLVPTNIFQDISSQVIINENSIADIAEHFSVSREVILRKLYDSKRIDQEMYDLYSTKWINEAKEARKEKRSGGDYYATRIAYLGRNFVNIVFREYYSNRISIFDVANYLNVKVGNISTLEMLL